MWVTIFESEALMYLAGPSGERFITLKKLCYLNFLSYSGYSMQDRFFRGEIGTILAAKGVISVQDCSSYQGYETLS